MPISSEVSFLGGGLAVLGSMVPAPLKSTVPTAWPFAGNAFLHPLSCHLPPTPPVPISDHWVTQRGSHEQNLCTLGTVLQYVLRTILF